MKLKYEKKILTFSHPKRNIPHAFIVKHRIINELYFYPICLFKREKRPPQSKIYCREVYIKRNITFYRGDSHNTTHNTRIFIYTATQNWSVFFFFVLLYSFIKICSTRTKMRSLLSTSIYTYYI